MSGARTSHSLSATPPSSMRPIPSRCCRPFRVLARSCASCCAMQCMTSVASLPCSTAPPMRDSAHAVRNPAVHAWGLLAQQSAMRPSRGPVPTPPRCSSVPLLQGKTCCHVWRTSMIKGKRCAAWRTHWAGRSLICSRVKRPVISPSFSSPKGAERVRPAPHSTSKGGASRERILSSHRRRLGTR